MLILGLLDQGVSSKVDRPGYSAILEMLVYKSLIFLVIFKLKAGVNMNRSEI